LPRGRSPGTNCTSILIRKEIETGRLGDVGRARKEEREQHETNISARGGEKDSNEKTLV